MNHAECLRCRGDGEFAPNGKPSSDYTWTHRRIVHGLYVSARNAVDFARHYRGEDAAKGLSWRDDPRIDACLEQVETVREEIRRMRAEVRLVRAMPYGVCIACRGAGYVEMTCVGCDGPVDEYTIDGAAFDDIGVVLHRGCEAEHSCFAPRAHRRAA
jgi:hypothetical protein